MCGRLVGLRDSATMWSRGVDRFGNFEPEFAPVSAILSDAAIAFPRPMVMGPDPGRRVVLMQKTPRVANDPMRDQRGEGLLMIEQGTTPKARQMFGRLPP